jgi:pre-rRNA-processing protein IPI3
VVDLCWQRSSTKAGLNSSVADTAKNISEALASVFGLTSLIRSWHFSCCSSRALYFYFINSFAATAVSMLTESFVVSTLASDKGSSSSSSTLKDVGICLHELQPHLIPRQSHKKSSTHRNCLAISESHIFAAQAEKALILVYNREKGNQEATIPFPERIHSLAYAGVGSALLVIGTAEGRLILWELASGRQVISTASHLQAISSLVVTKNHGLILSGSADSSIHVWSLLNLISFPKDSTLSSGNALQNVPLRTFPNHRSGITALSCGHSRTATNFAISASEDDTCYIWAIDSCELLRAILLPSTPLCFAVDPADRAIYAGYEDGNIHYIDLFRTGSSSATRATASVHDATQDSSVYLDTKDVWSAASVDVGSTQCICLSYDGTMLLSGHSSGRVLSWDVAKGRVQKSIADFGQSVTNLVMLRPDGLPSDRTIFQVKTITKPKVDYSVPTKRGTIGIPPGYTLQGQIVPHNSSSELPTRPEHTQPQDSFRTALTSPFFSQSMIDEAIKDLSSTSQAGSHLDRAATDMNLAKIDRLEEQIAKLNGSIQQYATAAERSRLRRLARMEQRDELGYRKRSAYFEAKAKGEDGDKAMEEWEEKEREVDAVSDDEEMADGLEAQV